MLSFMKNSRKCNLVTKRKKKINDSWGPRKDEMNGLQRAQGHFGGWEGGDVYVHYFYHGCDFTGIYICQTYWIVRFTHV